MSERKIIPFPQPLKKKRKSPEEIFDQKYPVDPDIEWARRDGTKIFLKDMDLFHLYHALILVWNYNIPEDYVLPPYHKCKFFITRHYRRHLLLNMFNELCNRYGSSVTDSMMTVLNQMVKWVVAAKKKEAPKQLF